MTSASVLEEPAMKARGWIKTKPECHQVASRCVLLCWYLHFVFIKLFFKFKKPYLAGTADSRLRRDELFSSSQLQKRPPTAENGLFLGSKNKKKQKKPPLKNRYNLPLHSKKKSTQGTTCPKKEGFFGFFFVL